MQLCGGVFCAVKYYLSNNKTLVFTCMQSADDEGFESLETSSSSSTTSEQATQDNTDIWSAALALPSQKFYTWEMEGRYSKCLMKN